MQQEIRQHPAEESLSREERLALNNRRAGLFIFQISWMMVFFCLIIVNWQLRFSYPSWPPPGVEKLGNVLPTIATLALLLSSFLARRANRAIAQDRYEEFVVQWRYAIGLGVLFAAIMVYEWLVAPMGTQYGTLFRVMTGFHGVHALAIGAIMVRDYRHRIEYGPLHYWPVEAATKLWYFVTIAWILFYLVLYWI